MKFTLRTTEWLYPKPDPKLEALGFEFELVEYLAGENKYALTNEPIEIEVSSIEDLQELIDSVGEVIVGPGYIEIYNGYRE
jgi:hypothetical protein